MAYESESRKKRRRVTSRAGFQVPAIIAVTVMALTEMLLSMVVVILGLGWLHVPVPDLNNFQEKRAEHGAMTILARSMHALGMRITSAHPEYMKSTATGCSQLKDLGPTDAWGYDCKIAFTATATVASNQEIVPVVDAVAKTVLTSGLVERAPQGDDPDSDTYPKIPDNEIDGYDTSASFFIPTGLRHFNNLSCDINARTSRTGVAGQSELRTSVECDVWTFGDYSALLLTV